MAKYGNFVGKRNLMIVDEERFKIINLIQNAIKENNATSFIWLHDIDFSDYNNSFTLVYKINSQSPQIKSVNYRDAHKNRCTLPNVLYFTFYHSCGYLEIKDEHNKIINHDYVHAPLQYSCYISDNATIIPFRHTERTKSGRNLNTHFQYGTNLKDDFDFNAPIRQITSEYKSCMHLKYKYELMKNNK